MRARRCVHRGRTEGGRFLYGEDLRALRYAARFSRTITRKCPEGCRAEAPWWRGLSTAGALEQHQESRASASRTDRLRDDARIGQRNRAFHARDAFRAIRALRYEAAFEALLPGASPWARNAATNGNALAGRLAKSAFDLGDPSVAVLSCEGTHRRERSREGSGGPKEGKQIRVTARRAVVLACGGFPQTSHGGKSFSRMRRPGLNITRRDRPGTRAMA